MITKYEQLPVITGNHNRFLKSPFIITYYDPDLSISSIDKRSKDMDCKTESCKTVKLSCRVQTCIDTDTYSKLVEYQEQYGYDDMSSTVRNVLKTFFKQ